MPTFPRRIALLGSTGSVGQQVLDVVRCFPQQFCLVGLAAHNNITLLTSQIQEFKPSLAVCTTDTPEATQAIRQAIPDIVFGEQGLLEMVVKPEVEVVIIATSGLVGLVPALAAIKAGKTIALANKEMLVAAGHLLMQEVHRVGIPLLPLDSEHNAIWQCLRGESKLEVSRLLLTASGGPFLRTDFQQMSSVTIEQALSHPTWKMGPKITIDSAILMNKALEVIEAHWHFAIPYEQIDVVVHPESIIHSMVEFIDGSVKMLAGPTTMCLPILSALSYPARLNIADTELPQALRWTNIAQLHFEALDAKRFPCFQLALEAAKQGGTYPCALVGADEEAVTLFLEGKISLMDIASLIEAVLEQHRSVDMPDIPALLEIYTWARNTARKLSNFGSKRS